jgi:hypothetical protein
VSLFDQDLFGAMSGLGELPAGTASIDRLSVWTAEFPEVPSAATARSKGATRFGVRRREGGAEFTFYDESGRVIFGPAMARSGGSPVLPAADKESLPARNESDGGLLPASTATVASAGPPKWLPYALVGGGILVAGGILYAATRGPRKPAAVAANRRRRRRRK